MSQRTIYKLNGLRDVDVTKWTPLRVTDHRAYAARNKAVHWMKATAVGHHRRWCLTLEVYTSVGCYIKEFVHGDFDWTHPCPADFSDADVAQCCALDLIHVGLGLKENQIDVP